MKLYFMLFCHKKQDFGFYFSYIKNKNLATLNFFIHTFKKNM